LDCIKYAHENGCQWNEGVLISAAKYGHLDILKYAHENGCELKDIVSCAAALSKNYDCLIYTLENGKFPSGIRKKMKQCSGYKYY